MKTGFYKPFKLFIFQKVPHFISFILYLRADFFGNMKRGHLRQTLCSSCIYVFYTHTHTHVTLFTDSLKKKNMPRNRFKNQLTHVALKNNFTDVCKSVCTYYRLNILYRLLFCRQSTVRYSILIFYSNRKYEHTVQVQLGIFLTTNFLQSCKLTVGGDIASTYPGCCIILGI